MRGVVFSVVVLAAGAASVAVAGVAGGPIATNPGTPTGTLMAYSEGRPSASSYQGSQNGLSDPGTALHDSLRDWNNAPCSPRWGEPRLRRKGCLPAETTDATPQLTKPADDKNGKADAQN